MDTQEELNNERIERRQNTRRQDDIISRHAERIAVCEVKVSNLEDLRISDLKDLNEKILKISHDNSRILANLDKFSTTFWLFGKLAGFVSTVYLLLQFADRINLHVG